MIITSTKKLNCSIWAIDGTLTDTTTPSQNGPGIKDSESVLHIPQSSGTGASLSNAIASILLI